MNIAELTRLRDYLKNVSDKRFYMRDYIAWQSGSDGEPVSVYHLTDDQKSQITECNTVACIAGHHMLMLNPGMTAATYMAHVLTASTASQRALDISEAAGEWLFTGQWADKPMTGITRQDAIDYLTECIEAGELVGFVELEPEDDDRSYDW